MKFRLVEDLKGQFQVQAALSPTEGQEDYKEQWVGLDVMNNMADALKLAQTYKDKNFGNELFRFHEV